MGNNIDKVCTGLYVGGLMGATKKEVLSSNDITHVLSLVEGAEPHFPNDFKYKIISVPDSPSANLSQFFRECVDYIHECRTNGGSCYVHCAAGISRAVTISTMYVLTISTLKYEEALAVLQFSRKVANPNFGFRMQLKKYCREILEQERDDLKRRFPNPKVELNDEEELRKKFEEAKEAFAKEGKPITYDDTEYIDPSSLQT